tara:strand:+ start:2082 stop:4076 length:1995 start_codon:yes stop_codon:yes gene_type:complete
MKNSNCIIITQKEWLNWLAFGYLRVSPSRISYFDNTESSFDILMSYSVDNALNEEDAYLLASLVNDYSREELHVKRTSLSDYISIQAVQGFYTLSAKGADLLEYEAGQSHSILHDDSKIEELWNEWKNTQFRLRSLDKGNKFLEILGYPRFEVEPKLDDTLFSKLLKNYNRRELPQELQKHNKKNAFSWLVSNYEFSQIVDQSIYNQYKEWRNSSKLSVIYNDPMLKYLATDGECLIEQPSLIAEKIFFEGFYEKKDYFLAISFLVHYYNLLDNDYEINLQFLKTDLSFLDEIYSTKDISQLIVYFIGRRLNEVYLNSLYIAKNIDEKKPSMFDTNFFSNLKNEKLTLCNVDQVQLQKIIKEVHVIAEEIKLAYNIEVNKVQEPEIASDTIADSDLNQPTQSQAPTTDSDNSETNNNPIENLDTPSNTTDNNSSQTHLEAQNTVGSEKSEDSTNRINDSHQPTQSQTPTIDNSNNENDSILQDKNVDTASNTKNDDSTQPHLETQKSADSEDSGDNTKDINKTDKIECDTNLSNLSTTKNNENETLKRDQVQEDKKSINPSLSGDLFSLDNPTEELHPINPAELLRDAISTINELPKDKEKNGKHFRSSLLSKNARYKDEFKNLETLPNFFEAFAKIVGNDMKKHTRFAEFKKELLLNDSLPNK